MQKRALVYIHGKGGNVDEAAFYKPLLPDHAIIGMDYHSQTPWEAKAQFTAYFDELLKEYEEVSIVANSIGAFFAMHALSHDIISSAYLISPIVDMECLISNMMNWAHITEEQLHRSGEIATSFGENLSWQYLTYVREHPIDWQVPTAILYGSKDHMMPISAVERFAEQTGAVLTVMEGGEHWFHTEEQMRFLASWIKKAQTTL